MLSDWELPMIKQAILLLFCAFQAGCCHHDCYRCCPRCHRSIGCCEPVYEEPPVPVRGFQQGSGSFEASAPTPVQIPRRGLNTIQPRDNSVITPVGPSDLD